MNIFSNGLLSGFINKAKGFIKNPLGIIALFLWLVYMVAALVLSTSIDSLYGNVQRLPLIYFIVIFPGIVLGAFVYLVVCHPESLYAPSDYKDEKYFAILVGNKGLSNKLEELQEVASSFEKKIEKEETKNLSAEFNKVSSIIKTIKSESEEMQIPINALWKCNHWGSNCASIVEGKMVFSGLSVPKGTEDGSHFNLYDTLEVGNDYEISCFAKSEIGTTGMFRLWCHDNTGSSSHGINVATSFKVPSFDGEKIKLNFRANFNKNIRVHLQYMPGQGKIEISDVKISKVSV